jgi:hypothetical protein
VTRRAEVAELARPQTVTFQLLERQTILHLCDEWTRFARVRQAVNGGTDLLQS